MRYAPPPPPRVPRRLLALALPDDVRDAIDGDLHELFNRRCAERGRRAARLWYWLEALSFVLRFTLDGLHRFLKGDRPPVPTSQPSRSNGRMRTLEGLRADLHFARRYFGRNRTTVAIIVSVFALGIGANTALMTTIQSQLFRPAPVVEVDDAVVLLRVQQRATRTSPWRPRGFSNEEIGALANHSDIFAAVNGWLAHDVVLDVADSVGARGVRAHFVTPGFFSALGVGIAAGAGFTNVNDDAAANVAVMSWEWAEQLYGVATSAAGRRILVNEVPVNIVGVSPPAFQGALRQMDRPALFIPVGARAGIARVSPRWLSDEPSMEAFARMAPGVERDRATTIARVEVTRSLPDSAERVGMTRVVDAWSMHALLPESYELKIIFTALAVVGLLLLLVTCTNVSSLMVAAAVARRQEIAVRLSLGASRGRILRQLLTEATLLAVAGGTAGLMVCWWMLRLLAGPGGTVDGNRVLPDAWTLAYTMLVALATGIIFGLSPAMHATRNGVGTALRDSGSGATRQSRLQRGFVVAQIVFSLPLLVMLGASLSMVVSDYEPLRPEVSQRVAMITFRPLKRTGAPGQRAEAVDSLAPRIVAHPEVVAVVPDASWYMVRRFLAPVSRSVGTVDTAFATLRVFGAAPGWFALQDIPILLGRDVTLDDTAATRLPVVIGSKLARVMWGDAHPIGRTFASPGDRDSVELVVVGVYDASRVSTAGMDSTNVFTAHGKEWRRDALLVRTRGDAEAFLPALRRMVRDLAPGLPVSRTLTLAHADESERVETITVAALVGAGGVLALLLASLGLYGVIALAVRQRTREIGIRIALGAKPGRVARMFLASGVRLGVMAIVIGLPLSMAALRLLLTQGGLIAPRVDIWLVGAGVALVLVLVAAGATWLPARRAALVDPARTLRVD